MQRCSDVTVLKYFLFFCRSAGLELSERARFLCLSLVRDDDHGDVQEFYMEDVVSKVS